MLRNWSKCVLLIVITAVVTLLCTANLTFAQTKSKASKPTFKKQSVQKIPLTQADIATMLHWVPTPTSICNLCGGYFQEPNFLLEHPAPGSLSNSRTVITSEGPGTYRKDGVTVLHKNVVAKQPGRIVTADTAYLYHNAQTKKFERIKLTGHVHLEEYGKLVIGPHGTLNLKDDTASFGHTTYHLVQYESESKKHKKKNRYDSWGTAKRAIRTAGKIMKFWGATYSTCSPLNPTWVAHSSRLTIDKEANRGTAVNSVITVHHIPVFYMPYYSFPLGPERKTGFLTPVFGIRSGFDLTLPFYWNMAPNYDMTISPRWLTKRGVLTSALYRYRTDSSFGQTYASFIPHDKGFKQFKAEKSSIQNVTPIYTPYVNQLNRDSINRGLFGFKDQTLISKNWLFNLDVGYVTDAYYFQDFGSDYETISSNQIRDFTQLDYKGDHWNVTFLAEAYQTLHLIDQISVSVQNQYTRLPEMDATADYPNFYKNLGFHMDSQIVNFLYSSSFFPISEQNPLGQRLHLRPGLSMPFNWAQGYLTPAVYLDSTTYNSEPATVPYLQQIYTVPPNTPPRRHLEASRNLPIIDVDSGLYLERYFNVHQHGYVQTLEPRLFYLYVPNSNQNKYPVFDTYFNPFSYSQLFLLNRFTGYDRLENANDFSLGISSRILDGYDAKQILQMDLGIQYRLQKPRVRLRPSDIVQEPNHLSPIVGDIKYYPLESWSISGAAAYSFAQKSMQNISLGTTYDPDSYHILTLVGSYARNFQQRVDPLGLSNNTYQVTGGTSWRLLKNWSVIGYYQYNVSRHRPNGNYVGLEYDSCCVAIRFIMSRAFTGTDTASRPGNVINRYQHAYFIQIQLKGLGGIGNKNPNGLITGTLPGYTDPFRKQLF